MTPFGSSTQTFFSKFIFFSNKSHRAVSWSDCLPRGVCENVYKEIVTSWHPIGRNFLDHLITLINFQNIFKFRPINFNNNRFRKNVSYKEKKPITQFLLYVCMCVLCDMVDWCNRWNSNLFEMIFKYHSGMFHHVSDILGLKNQKSDNFVKFPYIVESLYKAYHRRKWSDQVIDEIQTCLKSFLGLG